MKHFFYKSIVGLSTWLMSTIAFAAQDPIKTYSAFFDPSTSSAQCRQIFLGDLSEDIVHFETDGRVKAQIALYADEEGQLTRSRVLIHHKAFIPYFNTDKTPVPFENGPQMIVNKTLDSYLPALTSTDGFVLAGYGIPWVRSTVNLFLGDDILLVNHLYESADSQYPEEQDLRAIRSADLIVEKDEVVLKVTQLFNDYDHKVPEFYKTRAPWTRDTLCKLTRM